PRRNSAKEREWNLPDRDADRSERECHAGEQHPGGKTGRKNERGDRDEHPQARRFHHSEAAPPIPSMSACTSTSSASSMTAALTTKYPGLNVSGNASSSITDCQTIGHELHKTNIDPGTRIASAATRARNARSAGE